MARDEGTVSVEEGGIKETGVETTEDDDEGGMGHRDRRTEGEEGSGLARTHSRGECGFVVVGQGKRWRTRMCSRASEAE